VSPTTEGATAAGPTIDEIVVGDPPEAWVAAGFTVDPDGVCRIGTVRVRLVGRERGKRILEWSLRDLTTDLTTDLATGIDGLPSSVSERAPAEPATHANGSELIDHIVLATPDSDRTVAALEAVGFVARRTRQIDTYGAPMRQTFFRAGEVIVELVGPDEPSGDGSTAFFGLALTVTDLDGTAALLDGALGAPKDAVQPGRRIATLRHRDLGMSVAIAFMTPEPG
jgi:hypothetical protein